MGSQRGRIGTYGPYGIPNRFTRNEIFLSLVREIVGLGSAGGGSEGKKAKAGKTERRLREAREERQALEEGSEE